MWPILLIVSLIPIIAADVPQKITSPLGKKMSLKFHDEFDAVTDSDGKPYIDRKKWQTTFWQGSSERSLFGNAEAEYYVDKYYPGNNSVPGEVLNPFSFEQQGVTTINTWRVPQNLWKKYWMGTERSFASGLLISDQMFDFKYGYVEGRFKLPATRGSWPAFWLLVMPFIMMILGNDPSQASKDKAHEWPPEIDIFEFFGHRPTKHSAGIIVKKGESLPWHFGYNEVSTDITKDFHTWAMEWNEHEIAMLFDNHIWARTNITESLRRPMYLLINMAVGGTWYSQEMKAAGHDYKAWEVDETSMPWKMHLDYVRVYQE